MVPAIHPALPASSSSSGGDGGGGRVCWGRSVGGGVVTATACLQAVAPPHMSIGMRYAGICSRRQSTGPRNRAFEEANLRTQSFEALEQQLRS